MGAAPALFPWGAGQEFQSPLAISSEDVDKPTSVTRAQNSLLVLGEPWSPLTPFTVSQKDMCLVFVAFASWAVRTSDLHTPDAWKTGGPWGEQAGCGD